MRKYRSERLTTLVAFAVGIAASLVFPANAALAEPNCPHLTTSSCPTPGPQPPPPPTNVTCHTSIDPPERTSIDVGVEGTVECDDEVTSLSLIVTLQIRGSNGVWREIARDHGTRYNWFTLTKRASTACERGRYKYRGTVQATVNKPPVASYPLKFSADREFTC
jgi:hypothetical protein